MSSLIGRFFKIKRFFDKSSFCFKIGDFLDIRDFLTGISLSTLDERLLLKYWEIFWRRKFILKMRFFQWEIFWRREFLVLIGDFLNMRDFLIRIPLSIYERLWSTGRFFKLERNYNSERFFEEGTDSDESFSNGRVFQMGDFLDMRDFFVKAGRNSKTPPVLERFGFYFWNCQ